MEKLEKPVPVPRRALPAPASAPPTKPDSSAFTEVNANKIFTRPESASNDQHSNAFTKPVPLPRKLIQRLSSSSSSSERRKSRKEKELNATLGNISFNESEITDEMKRGTINIFKRPRNVDPFDNEFETNLKDAQLLTDVTFASPLEDLPPESRSSLACSTISSSNSNSTCDDYYVNPNTNSTYVDKFVRTSLDNTLMAASYPSTSASMQSGPVSFCGETNDCYLDTEGNESVYEPISSYSSSSSTSGSVMNEYPSLPTAASMLRGHCALSKRSTVPIVGINGHHFNASESIESDFEFSSKSRYERLKDDKLDSLSSSMTGIDRKLENLEHNRGSLGGNTTAITSNIRRNTSNASTKSDKRKTQHDHEYDDVAMENGTVVFLDNQMNTVSTQSGSSTNPNNSNSSIVSHNSVVMEFDPLFDTKCDNYKDGSNSNSINEEPPHRYEFIDGEFESDDHEHASIGVSESQFLSLTPTITSNLEYFPIKVDSLGRKNVSEKSEEFKKSDSDEEYEPVGPIIDIPSVHSKFRKSKSPPTPIDQDGSIESSQKNDTAVSTNFQGGFLRRLSNKIRLGPIREEVGKSLQLQINNLSPTSSVVSSCNKCFEEHSEGSKCKFVPSARSDVVYSSNLYKQSGIKKEFTKRFAVLSQGKVTFQNDKAVISDEVLLEKVGIISRKEDSRTGTNQQELHFFVLHFVSGKIATLTLGSAGEIERCLWMQKYMEAFTSGFSSSIACSYDRGGWCFMKEGLTNNWNPCWLILKERSLYYSVNSTDKYLEMDLRKARSVSSGAKDGDHMCPFVDNGDVLTIDMSLKIFYIQTVNAKHTAGWAKAIQDAAKRNGPNFDQMQLTSDNVPVIVDKCIDFLYAHGTLAEGIYRQSGSNSRITQLLADFQKDAWAVQISPKEFSAHDVAGTLKRFFRTLPEPLVTAKLYDEWIQTSCLKNHTKKLEAYDGLLEDVPIINYNILKKLICHLYAVHELHEKNLMPLINLAPIWGPTLMTVDTTKLGESAQSYKVACAECEVVKDLIENYYTLFRIDSQERDKEKKMQDALENFHLGSTKRKCSGDMKMWIYILKKEESSAINITLTPSSTAYAIAQSLCKASQIRNGDNLFLHEVICQGALQRPLHSSEKVIETVLRWSIWDIDERKNNYLILSPNTLYPELEPYARDPVAVYADFKFVDSKSKTFKKYAFTFSRAILKYTKDSKECASWKIEDIVWYLGFEQKRTPPTRWTFTFVKKNYPFKRSKDEPFFGNVVCCNSEEELHRWIGAMVVGEHPAGLYPSVLV